MDDASAPIAAPTNDPRWQAVFARLLQTEGGFIDSPGDHGGATNYGLSLRFLGQQRLLSPALMAEVDINHDGVVDLPDIRSMTVATARDVYWTYFWEPFASGLPQPIDAAVFDQTVNDGAVPAVKLLQAALNSLPHPGPDLGVDGAWGPQTAAALKYTMANQGAQKVLDAYRAQAAARYRLIVQRDPAQGCFLNGWLRRAMELGDV